MITVNFAEHSTKITTNGTELIVALDFPRTDHALDFIEKLKELPVIYKVGLELFLSGGPNLVRELLKMKKRVFLDLKLHDIPNTVARAAYQASLLHVEMLSLHIAGGSAMIRSTVEALSEIPLIRPKLLGVSVLTSFDDVRWAEVTKAMTGHAVDTEDSVNGLVEQAVSWGVDGVVCSAYELRMIKARFPALYTVVPGIRPIGIQADDQARTMTPAQAKENGASAIVVGRPITNAPDPYQMALQILNEISAKPN